MLQNYSNTCAHLIDSEIVHLPEQFFRFFYEFVCTQYTDL